MLVDEEWKNLTGCTTVLNVIAKPFLIPWAARMAVDLLKPKLKEIKELSQASFELLLEEARTAHCKRRDKGGNYGTKVHDEIHLLILDAITNSFGYIQGTKKSEEKSVRNFIKWAIVNKVKFLETEKNIYSEELFVGGIADFVCEIDKQIWLGDIKTSKSGIYPENFWQCGGYHLMLEAMGLYPDITGYLILNLKKSGEVLEKRSVSMNESKEAFLSCLSIYRIKEKIKSSLI